MDQQSSVAQEMQSPFVNPLQQDIEEGEVVQIKQKIKKVKITKNNRCEIDGSDSEWSWDSIEDLKGVDLKNLQAEEEGTERIQPEHKEKQKIKVIFPEKPKSIENLSAKYVGNATQLVGDLLIVQADLKQTYQVVDLDGWVCDNNKNFIGFVIDVFGKIQSPFYAIKPEEQLQDLQSLVGKQIFYIEGTKILNEDEVKSIQSKNNKEFDVQQLSSSSEQEKQERQMSVQAPQLYKEHKNKNFVDNKRNRKSSFDHGDRNQERSRTRENFKNKNWNTRQNNQQYLQQMYTMHYNQMMQFYNPNYQANTATIPTIPSPPFGNPSPSFGNPPTPFGNSSPYGNPPNFVPGNTPTFMQNQPPRGNSFMPPQNNYPPQGNYPNQDNRNMRR